MARAHRLGRRGVQPSRWSQLRCGVVWCGVVCTLCPCLGQCRCIVCVDWGGGGAVGEGCPRNDLIGISIDLPEHKTRTISTNESCQSPAHGWHKITSGPRLQYHYTHPSNMIAAGKHNTTLAFSRSDTLQSHAPATDFNPGTRCTSRPEQEPELVQGLPGVGWGAVCGVSQCGCGVACGVACCACRGKLHHRRTKRLHSACFCCNTFTHTSWLKCSVKTPIAFTVPQELDFSV